MSIPLLHISTFQIANIIIVMVLVFIGYKYLETFWSYRTSKPYAWELAAKNKFISKELIKIERGYRDKARFYNLWFQVEQLKKNKISGSFAELGVHKGKTAKAIHHMDPERTFYLFDTFEGFAKEDLSLENQHDNRFSKEMFDDTSIDNVRRHIKGNNNLCFKSGIFPKTLEGLETEKFALVHIDADLYAPTIEGLRFFYSGLNDGGVIIVHDYNHNWDGVPKAMNEFIKSIPESLIELSDWQGSAMIIKNT